MMAGSPAVRLLSVAVTRTAPLTVKDRLGPGPLRRSWLPAARGAVGAEPSWVQLPACRLNSMSWGLPLFQKYRPRYRFWPPFWALTAGPTHCHPLNWVAVTSIWEYWSAL